MRKLYRSEKDKVLAGILGGFGEYFHIDSTLLRAIYVIGALLTALVPLTVAYILLIFIIPKHPKSWIEEVRAEDEVAGPPHRPWR